MFQTPKWDFDASSESLYSLFVECHSRNGRKKKNKSKKDVKTKKIIKHKQSFQTEVDQSIQTSFYNVAIEKNIIKPESLSLPAVSNKMQNAERRKVKNEREKKRSLSGSKEKCQSFDHESNTRMSEVPVTHLGSRRKRKRSLLSDSGSVQRRSKKRKKNSSQDDLLSSESNTVNKHTDSGNEKLRQGNGKNHKKKHRESIDSRHENLSETLQKSGSTVKSPYSTQRLKQMILASNTNQLNKESISENKRVKETGTLRERMLRRLQGSHFRYINEQLYTSGGKDAKEYFEAEPEAFEAYHEGYKQQVQQWPINPLDVIIKALKKKSSELVVADFGCGDARLARSIPNKVHSFDLVATSNEVTVCNMARTPLSTASVDIVVFCLSLMGTDLRAYLTEANRVLKERGLLKIAEVESRFEDVQSFIQKLEKFGFVNTWKDLSHNLFYFMDFKKEKCISKKMKKRLPELILKPCLYKKR